MVGGGRVGATVACSHGRGGGGGAWSPPSIPSKPLPPLPLPPLAFPLAVSVALAADPLPAVAAAPPRLRFPLPATACGPSRRGKRCLVCFWYVNEALISLFVCCLLLRNSKLPRVFGFLCQKGDQFCLLSLWRNFKRLSQQLFPMVGWRGPPNPKKQKKQVKYPPHIKNVWVTGSIKKLQSARRRVVVSSPRTRRFVTSYIAPQNFSISSRDEVMLCRQVFQNQQSYLLLLMACEHTYRLIELSCCSTALYVALREKSASFPIPLNDHIPQHRLCSQILSTRRWCERSRI